MIKANDLRIGNLIFSRHGFGWENAGVVKVKSINSEGINAWSDMGASGVGKFEDIEPIPLTPEILEKAGVVKTHQAYDQGDDDKYVLSLKNSQLEFGKGDHYKGGTWGLGLYYHGTELHYLHQLQNLYFALTGE